MKTTNNIEHTKMQHTTGSNSKQVHGTKFGHSQIIKASLYEESFNIISTENINNTRKPLKDLHCSFPKIQTILLQSIDKTARKSVSLKVSDTSVIFK